MEIGSADVNRVLRRLLHPALRAAGFTKFKGRRAWRYLEDSVWALEIRTVGKYSAGVTGFPSTSLSGELCIFFPDLPSTDPGMPDAAPPRDVDGLLVPKPLHCHIRYPLKVGIDQTIDRTVISHRVERERDDVWFVKPDGTALDAVVEDMRRSVIERGIPLLLKPCNSRIEQMRRRGLASATPG